jgi:hypothetical protein
MLARQGIMQGPNLLVITQQALQGRYLGPCGPRELPSATNVAVYYCSVFMVCLAPGMRKIDPHRHAARQGHRAGLNLA